MAALVEQPLAREALREALDGVRDVERLAGKAAAGRANPRELGALGASLGRLPAVREALERASAPSTADDAAAAPDGTARRSTLHAVLERWDDCAELAAVLAASLVDRPPTAIGEEETIRTGVDAELDELRALCSGGKDAIARIQEEERQRTGIGSLKVGYNRVFGYYIEVTNANRHLVPDEYQRRQTLTGAERYVTPALKDVRGEGADGERAHRAAGARAVRVAARARGRADQAAAAGGGLCRLARRARRALPRWRRARSTCGRC